MTTMTPKEYYLLHQRNQQADLEARQAAWLEATRGLQAAGQTGISAMDAYRKRQAESAELAQQKAIAEDKAAALAKHRADKLKLDNEKAIERARHNKAMEKNQEGANENWSRKRDIETTGKVETAAKMAAAGLEDQTLQDMQNYDPTMYGRQEVSPEQYERILGGKMQIAQSIGERQKTLGFSPYEDPDATAFDYARKEMEGRNKITEGREFKQELQAKRLEAAENRRKANADARAAEAEKRRRASAEQARIRAEAKAKAEEEKRAQKEEAAKTKQAEKDDREALRDESKRKRVLDKKNEEIANIDLKLAELSGKRIKGSAERLQAQALLKRKAAIMAEIGPIARKSKASKKFGDIVATINDVKVGDPKSYEEIMAIYNDLHRDGSPGKLMSKRDRKIEAFLRWADKADHPAAERIKALVGGDVTMHIDGAIIKPDVDKQKEIYNTLVKEYPFLDKSYLEE